MTNMWLITIQKQVINLTSPKHMSDFLLMTIKCNFDNIVFVLNGIDLVYEETSKKDTNLTKSKVAPKSN